jgi:hypothetical protein
MLIGRKESISSGGEPGIAEDLLPMLKLRDRLLAVDVLSESLLHLPLWMIFRHMHINLINVRSTYAS